MKLTTKKLKEMIEKELSETGMHPDVHEEGAIQETVILMVQAANRVMMDKHLHDQLIAPEQVPDFLIAMQDAVTSIIEEFTNSPGASPTGRLPSGPMRR
jgi:hypothetical protein